MKKLLLTLALGTAILGASAQEQVESTIEVVNDFTGSECPEDLPSNTQKKYTLYTYQGVEYGLYYTAWNSANGGMLQISNNEGAYFTAQLADKNCSKITLGVQGENPNGSVIEVYAGDKLINTLTITTSKTTAGTVLSYPVEITDEGDQKAGTIYKFVRVSPETADRRCRLQLANITYTCTPKEDMPAVKWDEPVISVPAGCYVLPGQKIYVTAQEGARLVCNIRYTEEGATATTTAALDENGCFTVPENVMQNSNIRIQASAKDYKDSNLNSEIVDMTVKFTNGSLEINETGMYSIRSSYMVQYLYFWFNALNFDTTTDQLLVDLDIYDKDNIKTIQNIEVSAKPQEEMASVFAESEITPVYPVNYNATATFQGLAEGDYTADVYYKINDDGKRVKVNDAPVAFTVKNSYTSGVEDVENAENVEPVYYNLQGVQVAPVAGQMMIRVCGSKVQKIVIR